jgi:hypothetical protein
MKHTLPILTIFLLLGGCAQSQPDTDFAQYSIESRIGDAQYEVVIVEDDGISRREAGQYAMQRAADVTRSNGYRYFVIEDEGQVIVFKGSGMSEEVPQNMYYSMVQEGSSYYEPTKSQQIKKLPAYRIRFACYEEKPSRHAIDTAS